jgi:prepilin-type N-terminal cleavage/methylation domain-containing protein
VKPRSAFTLIELLVVIAILAVLAVVVVLTLNPAGLLQESRDANRLSDMSTLKTALSAWQADGGTNLGTANVVYVSIPDPTATSTAGDQCQGLGLISLPSAYTYQCPGSSTYRATNGTGWIPINLSAATFGTPLTLLPIDPVNQSSSRLYYTYTTDANGHFELTANFESSKYRLGGSGDEVSGDGGTLATVYETGSKLGLEPLDYGDKSLVGLWTFEEGSSSIAYDYSGSNATGSWQGTPTGTAGYYSAGKIGNWAGSFDGSTDYINSGNPAILQITGTLSLSFWLKPFSAAPAGTYGLLTKTDDGSQRSFGAWVNASGMQFQISSDGSGSHICTISQAIPDTNWHQWMLTFNPATQAGSIFMDGSLKTNSPGCGGWTGTSIFNSTTNITLGSKNAGASWPLNGTLDDVRIYNRALSAAEVAALYSGGR